MKLYWASVFVLGLTIAGPSAKADKIPGCDAQVVAAAAQCAGMGGSLYTRIYVYPQQISYQYRCQRTGGDIGLTSCGYGHPMPPDVAPTSRSRNNKSGPPECGSIITVQQGAISESVWITGTPHRLVYSSERQKGRVGDLRVVAPLTESSVDADLDEVTATLEVAGQTLTQTYSAAPNLSHTFNWDGNDALAVPVVGKAEFTLRRPETWI